MAALSSARVALSVSQSVSRGGTATGEGSVGFCTFSGGLGIFSGRTKRSDRGFKEEAEFTSKSLSWNWDGVSLAHSSAHKMAGNGTVGDVVTAEPPDSAFTGIPTLPLSAALAATGTEVAMGPTCRIWDRPNKKQVCLFYTAENEDLAIRISQETDSVELQSILWRTFPDGFPNLFVPNAHGIRGQHGTLERMEDEGDIATAFTLARILSNIPISRGGPTSLVIFDIHALQERFYFGDNVLPCFESGIPLLKHRLHQLPDSQNVTIAFPDEGAFKRFHMQLQHFPAIVCTKIREGKDRIVSLKEGDPRGRHVVIVDDLVQSGSTLIECHRLLARHGACKVSAYATHGVFPKQSHERFQHDGGKGAEHGFSHFWITDSCPQTVKAVMGKPPFEILSLAGSIAAALHI